MWQTFFYFTNATFWKKERNNGFISFEFWKFKNSKIIHMNTHPQNYYHHHKTYFGSNINHVWQIFCEVTEFRKKCVLYCFWMNNLLRQKWFYISLDAFQKMIFSKIKMYAHMCSCFVTRENNNNYNFQYNSSLPLAMLFKYTT